MKIISFIFLFLFIVCVSKCITTISICADLQNMQNNLTESYFLTKNLNCSGIILKPIGNISSPFQGLLDGGGFVIQGLNMNSSADNVGLFSVGVSAVVQNIIFSDFLVTSTSNNTALIFGQAVSVTITNVSLTALVQSMISSSLCIKTLLFDVELLFDSFKRKDCTGGFCGQMKNSTITNCTLQNTLVQGKNFVGGFAGSSFSSNLFHCFNLGFPGSPSTFIISGSKIFKRSFLKVINFTKKNSRF